MDSANPYHIHKYKGYNLSSKQHHYEEDYLIFNHQVGCYIIHSKFI